MVSNSKNLLYEIMLVAFVGVGILVDNLHQHLCSNLLLALNQYT